MLLPPLSSSLGETKQPLKALQSWSRFAKTRTIHSSSPVLLFHPLPIFPAQSMHPHGRPGHTCLGRSDPYPHAVSSNCKSRLFRYRISVQEHQKYHVTGIVHCTETSIQTYSRRHLVQFSTLFTNQHRGTERYISLLN